MRTASWRGPAPPRGLTTALARAGWTIGGEGPTVVSSRRGDRAPPGPRSAGWLWLAGASISPAAAADASLRGAVDCIDVSAPGAAERLLRRLEESLAREPDPPPAPTFVTRSEAGRRVLRQLAGAARTSQPVLITGETGTGKEVAARLIHLWSARRDRTFVPVNCAAIPNELMEAELFGYARGAFSGAVRGYDGQIAAAEGGTVLLDEIDDTPPPIQVKLLRVLEDRMVSRLGENVWRRVDFRLLAATNRDLAPLIADGKFGADLYERLAIVSIRLPALRERAEDIPELARHFVRRFNEEEPRPSPVEDLTPEALDALVRFPWPGNVRELRNAVYQALVDKRVGRELLLSDLPRRILSGAPAVPELPWLDAASRSIAAGAVGLRDAVRALERAALVAALARAGGNAAEAARLLGPVGRGSSRDPGGTVRAMMRRLGISGAAGGG